MSHQEENQENNENRGVDRAVAGVSIAPKHNGKHNGNSHSSGSGMEFFHPPDLFENRRSRKMPLLPVTGAASRTQP
ncbi:hypothetical protein [Mesorhizobium sp. NZP2298]|uniref:hypothetical protein n=1 Tax=Mesorhizobium sp. NZP2298 TaxID=2483403 RepID=UPI001555DF44|nr:hypothetical protein [Mesorhizobium sp. NZP2298]